MIRIDIKYRLSGIWCYFPYFIETTPSLKYIKPFLHKLLPNAMYNNNSLPIILLKHIILVLNANTENKRIKDILTFKHKLI